MNRSFTDSADFEVEFMLNPDELSAAERAENEAEKARLRLEAEQVKRQDQPVFVQPKDILRAGEKEELMQRVPVGNYVVTSPNGNRTVLEVRVAKSSGNQYVNIGQGRDKEYLGFSLPHLRLLAQSDLAKAAEDYKNTVREPVKSPAIAPVRPPQTREEWTREQATKRGLTDAQAKGLNMKWERDMANLDEFYFPSASPVQEASDDRRAILKLLAADTHEINGREVELTEWKYRHSSMEVSENGRKYPSGEIEAQIAVGGEKSVLAMEETFDEAGNFAGYGFTDSRENKSRLYPMLETVMGEEEYTEFLESGGSTVEKANEVFAPIVREANEKLSQWVNDREHAREA